MQLRRRIIRNHSFFVTVLLVVIAAAVGYGGARMVLNAFALRGESYEVQQQIEELKNRKEELEARIAELQNGEAVRREAKERLNLKLPGENVVVVVPEKQEVPDTSSSGSFWRRVIIFFKFWQ